MPRYEVRTLDVWGNGVEGYEVNNVFRAGTVLVRPQYDDLQLLQALIKEGHLNRQALELYEQGEVVVSDSGMGELIEVIEHEPVWAIVPEDAEEWRYGGETRAEAERDAKEGETVEESVGDRPILQLHLIEGDPEAKVFFRKKVKTVAATRASPGTGAAQWQATLELRTVPGKGEEKGRQYLVDAYVDGDFFTEVRLPKDLENEHELGLAANGAVVEGTEELASEALVAMDAFLDLGGVGVSPFVEPEPPKPKTKYERNAAQQGGSFLAQSHGPQSGYAYELDLDNVFDEDGRRPSNWNEAHNDDWEQVVVDRDDFGEEVGVVVLDGVEMRVWARAEP